MIYGVFFSFQIIPSTQKTQQLFLLFYWLFYIHNLGSNLWPQVNETMAQTTELLQLQHLRLIPLIYLLLKHYITVNIKNCDCILSAEQIMSTLWL